MKKKQREKEKGIRESEKKKGKEVDNIVSDSEEEHIIQMVEQWNVTLAWKKKELKMKIKWEIKQYQDSSDQGQIEKRRWQEEEEKEKQL